MSTYGSAVPEPRRPWCRAVIERDGAAGHRQATRRAVSINDTPACDTRDSPLAITDIQGCKSLPFTREVPLDWALSRIRGRVTLTRSTAVEARVLIEESLRPDSGPPPRTRHADQDHTEPFSVAG
jgi:hypothetical protein